MQAEMFEAVSVRPHQRRRPRRQQPADTRLLLADVLALLAAMEVPKRDEAARRFYGVKKRVREAVRQ
jgi:hypothetical protein